MNPIYLSIFELYIFLCYSFLSKQQFLELFCALVAIALVSNRNLEYRAKAWIIATSGTYYLLPLNSGISILCMTLRNMLIWHSYSSSINAQPRYFAIFFTVPLLLALTDILALSNSAHVLINCSVFAILSVRARTVS